MNGSSRLEHPFDAVETMEHGVPTGGFVGTLLKSSALTTLVVMIILSIWLVLTVTGWLLSPPHDPREPPILKSKVPILGHVFNILRFQGEFHSVLRKANPVVPLATLPMLNGKAYTIFEPDLIHAILRSKSASFEPYIVHLVHTTFDLTDEAFTKVVEDHELLPDLTDAIHRGFQHNPLRSMTRRLLGTISDKLDSIGDEGRGVGSVDLGQEKSISGGLEVRNFFLWCRDLMTLSTTKALYGDSDPFSKDQRLISLLWDFENAIPSFVSSTFPSITVPKGFRARKILYEVMGKYYSDRLDLVDPTTSVLIEERAQTLRRHGFNGEEIAKMETIQAVIATTNAIPTFFWMLIFILSRPGLFARLRQELEAAITFEPVSSDTAPTAQRTATLDVARFEEQLPLMASSYRETLRLINHAVSMRRVTSDISLTAANGNTYLLKEGVDIQMSAGVTHCDTGIWGPDASEFKAERFLPTKEHGSSGTQRTSQSSDVERSRKIAFFPFGGGKHLCPGRHLAFEEILGFVSLMLLRTDLEPLGMRFEDVKMEGAKLTAASCKPLNSGAGLGARIKRRRGWENTRIALRYG
ncbi:3-hydroxybutyryl dehydrogenase [Purpureocillium lavendulum]|uniref:3-hydroxybutyryl dehydrogenase n=1 Tax=Purpureocillium lavendulum TaxID=1247861 RepID=A0AB34FLI3_9HYPO|nr:3-hydroxybutyryl dehydrogenase [Purpureocillium lavendulum]